MFEQVEAGLFDEVLQPSEIIVHPFTAEAGGVPEYDGRFCAGTPQPLFYEGFVRVLSIDRSIEFTAFRHDDIIFGAWISR